MKVPNADDMRQVLAGMFGGSVDDFCPNCARPLDEDPDRQHDIEACGEEVAKLTAMLEEGITVTFNDGGPDEVWDTTNTRLI